jgi:hypothetical protein
MECYLIGLNFCAGRAGNRLQPNQTLIGPRNCLNLETSNGFSSVFHKKLVTEQPAKGQLTKAYPTTEQQFFRQ